MIPKALKAINRTCRIGHIGTVHQETVLMQNSFQSCKQDLQKEREGNIITILGISNLSDMKNYFWKRRGKPHQILAELRCPTS